ncbi:helix-turn-helix domain-containing protein [Streptomyces rubiginosohelvolus]|uniref:helix-turn-helix domain-containing protein n=1 Tax=Streptomyces rubiginosohelvolus TaxID=67362 RepID=UPI0036847678
MDQDMARLGAALKATRLARQPKLTEEQVARAAGFSRATLQNIEKGTASAKVTSTIREYARYLGWTDDSIERAFAGQAPRLLPDAEDGTEGAGAVSAPPRTTEGSPLPLRVVDAIESDGALVDTALIPLGEDATMVLLVKGRPGATADQVRASATPEEILAALEAYRRTQPQARELSTEEQGQSHAANDA